MLCPPKPWRRREVLREEFGGESSKRYQQQRPAMPGRIQFRFRLPRVLRANRRGELFHRSFGVSSPAFQPWVLDLAITKETILMVFEDHIFANQMAASARRTVVNSLSRPCKNGIIETDQVETEPMTIEALIQ